MINYSEPKFVSVEDIKLMEKGYKNKTTAICQCPLPIMMEIDGVKGCYCHIVEFNKEYVCKQCGTEFSVGRAF